MEVRGQTIVECNDCLFCSPPERDRVDFLIQWLSLVNVVTGTDRVVGKQMSSRYLLPRGLMFAAKDRQARDTCHFQGPERGDKKRDTPSQQRVAEGIRTPDFRNHNPTL